MLRSKLIPVWVNAFTSKHSVIEIGSETCILAPLKPHFLLLVCGAMISIRWGWQVLISIPSSRTYLVTFDQANPNLLSASTQTQLNKILNQTNRTKPKTYPTRALLPPVSHQPIIISPHQEAVSSYIWMTKMCRNQRMQTKMLPSGDSRKLVIPSS